MKKVTPEPKDRVTLRPIFGIHPTRYIPVFYSAVVAVILFLVFMLPGIINYGSHIRITPELSDAGIWIDDTYISSVSNKPFIEAGTYTITVKKPFFETVVMEDVSVPGRLFFSLFSKKTHTIPVEWQIDQTDEYLEEALASLGDWAPIDEYSKRYHYPDILTSAAEDMAAGGVEDSSQVESFFLSAMGFVTNDRIYRDLKTALGHLPEETASSITETDTCDLLTSYYEDDQSSFEECRQRVVSSGTEDTSLEKPETLEAAGLSFIRIPAADKVLLGDVDISFSDGLREFPYQWSPESYYIGSQEITESMYAEFVGDEPEWRRDNRRNLREDGLVDSMYLDSINLDSPTDRPIRNVSVHAAQAFTDWYSQELESKDIPYRASLPTEQQWEYAALVAPKSSEYDDRLLMVEETSEELHGMFGSVWEFTSSPYIPLAGVTSYQFETQASLHEDLSPELARTVKGGSYVNAQVSAAERGRINRSDCSPYIGFRLVLEEHSHE